MTMAKYRVNVFNRCKELQYMQAQTDLRLNNVIWRSNLHHPLEVSHKASDTTAGVVQHCYNSSCLQALLKQVQFR